VNLLLRLIGYMGEVNNPYKLEKETFLHISHFSSIRLDKLPHTKRKIYLIFLIISGVMRSKLLALQQVDSITMFSI